jgi:hypothetical protein
MDMSLGLNLIDFDLIVSHIIYSDNAVLPTQTRFTPKLAQQSRCCDWADSTHVVQSMVLHYKLLRHRYALDNNHL